jgi:hypothetical protein
MKNDDSKLLLMILRHPEKNCAILPIDKLLSPDNDVVSYEHTTLA